MSKYLKTMFGLFVISLFAMASFTAYASHHEDGESEDGCKMSDEQRQEMMERRDGMSEEERAAMKERCQGMMENHDGMMEDDDEDEDEDHDMDDDD